MNGLEWTIEPVEPGNTQLIDESGLSRAAVTDYTAQKIIYASLTRYDINGRNTVDYYKNLSKILIHELCHCVLYSYGLLGDIRKAVKEDYWIEAEEWICNFINDYGLPEVIRIFDKIARP